MDAIKLIAAIIVIVCGFAYMRHGPAGPKAVLGWIWSVVRAGLRKTLRFVRSKTWKLIKASFRGLTRSIIGITRIKWR